MSKKVKTGPTYREMLKVFFKSIREYKTPSILAMIFIALETCFECIIPFIMSKLINLMEKVNNSDLLTTVFIYSGILLALAICSFICGLTAGRLSAKATVGFATNLRRDIFTKITTFSFNNIDKFSISSLVTRQTTDV